MSQQLRRAARCQESASGQDYRLQGPKSLEVAVVGQYPGDTLSPADGGDLCIEDEVAECVGFLENGLEPVQKLFFRIRDGAGWRPKQVFDEFHAIERRRRRIEDAPVGDDTQEFRNAEHRQTPEFIAFSQSHQPLGGYRVQVRFLAMCVDQYVGT